MKGENSFALECHRRVRARHWAHRALNATLYPMELHTRLSFGKWMGVSVSAGRRGANASGECALPLERWGLPCCRVCFCSVRYVFEAHEYARHPLRPRGVWKLSLACGKECTPFVCTHIHQIFHANLAHWKFCINIVYTRGDWIKVSIVIYGRKQEAPSQLHGPMPRLKWNSRGT